MIFVLRLETLPLALTVLLPSLTSFENIGILLVGAIRAFLLTRLCIFGGFRWDERSDLPHAEENFQK